MAVKSTPTLVTGSSNRIIYKPDKYYKKQGLGKVGSFKYTVTDGIEISSPGIVTLVSSDQILTGTILLVLVVLLPLLLLLLCCVTLVANLVDIRKNVAERVAVYEHVV